MVDVCECFVHQRLYMTKGWNNTAIGVKGMLKLYANHICTFWFSFKFLKGQKLFFGQKMEKLKSGRGKGEG